MNKDIRLLVSFKGHRKRKRLKRLLGPGYLDYLIDLWLTTAQDRPEGILTGWDENDIADAAGWDGEPIKLIDALIESKWIDQNSETFILHGWSEHQGWACGAKQRSESASRAAKIRWEKKLNKQEVNTPRNATAKRKHQDRNAPSPSPSPSPKEIKDSSEPPPGIKIFCKIPLKDGGEFSLTDYERISYETVYKAIDVKYELNKCAQWNKDNKAKRKTGAGIKKHINSWLSRTNDQAIENNKKEIPKDAPRQPKATSIDAVKMATAFQIFTKRGQQALNEYARDHGLTNNDIEAITRKNNNE